MVDQLQPHRCSLKKVFMTYSIRAALVALVALLVFLSSPVSAGTNDVVALLQRNDLQRLERMLSRVQLQFENSELTEVELRNSFRPFYTLDSQAAENLQNWAAASPQSYVAHLGLGIYYKRLGSDARGLNAMSATPQSNIDTMKRYFRLSENALRSSLMLTQKPLLSIFHLMDITGTTGDSNATTALLLQGNKILPSTGLLRARYANYLLPRWGGSYAKLEKFITESEHQGVPPNVVLQLHAIEHDDKGHVLADQGNQADANNEFEKALKLGKEIGGSFSIDTLKTSRYYLCPSPKGAPYC